jgi:5-methylthioadenosine/S-adenosylhomocysteine deaminase
MVDILIKDAMFIITVDKGRRVIRNGAIAVEKDRIVEVGETEALKNKYKADVEIDAKGKVVLPGLINTHIHCNGTIFRGLGGDLDVYKSITRITMPTILSITRESMYVGSLLTCSELIRSGTTCFIDNQYAIADRENTDASAEAAKESGLRAIIAPGLQDSPTLPLEFRRSSISEATKDVERLIEKWHNTANGRIKIWLHPPIPGFWDTPEMCKEARRLANKHKIGITWHLSDSKRQTIAAKNMGFRNICEFCESTGLLGPDCLAVHAQWISDSEIDLLRRTDTKISHNPTFNQYEGDIVAPIIKMLNSGITVGLGTDSARGADDHDMIKNMKFAALIHKTHHLDPGIINADKVLEMATIDGARCLGLEDIVGSLEAGKKADIIIIDFTKPHLVPTFRPVNSIVYAANGNDVDTVIVDGKILMENREMKTIMEMEVMEKMQSISENLVRKAGLEDIAYRPWRAIPLSGEELVRDSQKSQ